MVQVGKPICDSSYLSEGAIVLLSKSIFGRTKYLEVQSFVDDILVEKIDGHSWRVLKENRKFLWNGRMYIERS